MQHNQFESVIWKSLKTHIIRKTSIQHQQVSNLLNVLVYVSNCNT